MQAVAKDFRAVKKLDNRQQVGWALKISPLANQLVVKRSNASLGGQVCIDTGPI